MFAEKKKVKKENIAKNEYQRLRNIAASRKVKVPEVGVPPLEGRMQPSQVKFLSSVYEMHVHVVIYIGYVYSFK